MTTFTTQTRTVKTRRPAFAIGVVGGTVLVRSWAIGGHAFDLIADEMWLDRDQADAYPFRLHWTEGGQPESKGFDTAADAELWAETLTTACPVEFAPTTHTRADELFWAQFAPMMPMPVCGGSPEPEAECTISGRWAMPGEDEDLEPVVRELSDDWTGDFGHQA